MSDANVERNQRRERWNQQRAQDQQEQNLDDIDEAIEMSQAAAGDGDGDDAPDISQMSSEELQNEINRLVQSTNEVLQKQLAETEEQKRLAEEQKTKAVQEAEQLRKELAEEKKKSAAAAAAAAAAAEPVAEPAAEPVAEPAAEEAADGAGDNGNQPVNQQQQNAGNAENAEQANANEGGDNNAQQQASGAGSGSSSGDGGGQPDNPPPDVDLAQQRAIHADLTAQMNAAASAEEKKWKEAYLEQQQQLFAMENKYQLARLEAKRLREQKQSRGGIRSTASSASRNNVTFGVGSGGVSGTFNTPIVNRSSASQRPAAQSAQRAQAAAASMRPPGQPARPAAQQAQPSSSNQSATNTTNLPQRPKFQCAKFPKNLPKWSKEKSVDIFVENTECIHVAYQTPPDLWVNALVTQTKGETQRWVTKEILLAGKTWQQARTAFAEHFGVWDAVGKAMDELMSLEQKPSQSVAAYRDEAMSLAEICNRDLNDRFVVRNWMGHLRVSIQRALLAHINPAKVYSFAEVSQLAIFVEDQQKRLSKLQQPKQPKKPRDGKDGKGEKGNGGKGKGGKGNGGKGNGGKGNGDKPKRTCSYCKKSGHSVEYCYKKRDDNGWEKGSCFACGSTEHKRKDCPTIKKKGSGSSGKKDKKVQMVSVVEKDAGDGDVPVEQPATDKPTLPNSSFIQSIYDGCFSIDDSDDESDEDEPPELLDESDSDADSDEDEANTFRVSVDSGGSMSVTICLDDFLTKVMSIDDDEDDLSDCDYESAEVNAKFEDEVVGEMPCNLYEQVSSMLTYNVQYSDSSLYATNSDSNAFNSSVFLYDASKNVLRQNFLCGLDSLVISQLDVEDPKFFENVYSSYPFLGIFELESLLSAEPHIQSVFLKSICLPSEVSVDQFGSVFSGEMELFCSQQGSEVEPHLPSSVFDSALANFLSFVDRFSSVQYLFNLPVSYWCDSVSPVHLSFDSSSKTDCTVHCAMLSIGDSISKPGSPTERAIIPSKKAIKAPVLLNSHKIYALLDSGSEISIIDKKLVQSLNLPVYRQSGTIKLATAGQTSQRTGYVLVNIRISDKTFDNVKLEVLNLSDASLLIGLDHWSLFGFRIEGVPYRFPEDGVPDQPPPGGILNEGTDPDSFVHSQWHDSDRLPPDQVKLIMDGIAAVLEENKQLSGRQRCSHPAATIPLDTGDHTPVYRSQYNVPQALEHVVTEKVNDWFERGVTARAPHSSNWNSPLLVVRKRDAQGNYTKHRVCIDPRAINQLIPDLKLTVPKIAEL